MSVELAAGIVAGVLVLLFGLDRMANRIVRPRPRARPPEEDVPELGVRHEAVVIFSGDHRLGGWLLHPEDGAATGEGSGLDGSGKAEAGHRPLVLMVHGWGAGYGPLVQLAEPLVEAGHPVLLFDVRGHGGNEEVPYATVRHFRDDIMAACAWAAERMPGRSRVLLGHSLGGAASVLAAERGAQVEGLVLVASPADVLEVTAEYMSSKGLPGRLLVLLLRPFWWRRVGGTFRALTPERQIRRLARPLLIIQPQKDHRVELDHARRLSEASSRPLHVIEGAGHTDVLGHPETHDLVLGFLETLAARAGDGQMTA